MIIGITGSSGSGKTTVTNILKKELKAEAIHADEVVKQMQKKGSEYYKKIIETFGTEIIEKEGTINKKKLAEIIYQDKNQKEKLDKLTYKYVVEEIKKQVQEAKTEYVIIDVPLLIESKLNEICKVVIAVVSDKKEQIKRICKRDKIEESKANLRLQAQKDNEFYEKNADYIVVNNGGKYDELLGRIRELVQELQ